jgi:hypothetical protein
LGGFVLGDHLLEHWLCRGTVVTFCLLLAAYLLVLTPYEGFDEIAHYSYISFLADERRIPTLGDVPLDRTLEEEREGLPTPYLAAPPYEDNGGITYREFFVELTDDQRQQIAEHFWTEAKGEVHYDPGDEVTGQAGSFPAIDSYNWQAQHPPFYYALMVVPYKLSTDWPAGLRLLWLRFFSVVFVVGSLLFWVKSIRLLPEGTTSRRYLLLGGVTILFFPSLFFDLARLGNDGLVACLFAGSFYFLLACVYQGEQKLLGNLMALSVLLGLGLLTKLYFLPIACGALLFYGWHARHGAVRAPWGTLLRHLLISAGIMLLIAGWWYVWCFVRYGTVFVSDEMMHFRAMAEAAGEHLPPMLYALQLVKVFAGFCFSFLWCGTQSWIPRSPTSYLLWLPLFFLCVWGGYRLFMLQKFKKSFWSACLFILVPVLTGFFYHMYQRVHFTGVGSGTGGYYLFVLWPLLGALAALAFKAATSRIGISLLVLAFGCVMIFEIGGWWLLLQIYAGVVDKTAYMSGKAELMGFTLSNVVLILDRLQVMVFSYVFAALYLLSLLLRISLIKFAILRCNNHVGSSQETSW